MLFRMLAMCCVAAVPVAGAAAQQNIGVAAVVQNRVTGELGPRERVLARGDRMFRNEKVATGAAGTLNVLFLDETSLSMGPNTTIVLDELVFDPSGSNGRVVLSVAVGVTRFVSGILPKSDYEIRTPTAVIGVRGTSFDLYVKPNGDSTVVLGSGELTMRERERSLAQAVRLAAPGLAVSVVNGASPSAPGPVPPDVAQALSQLPGAQLGVAGVAPRLPNTGTPLPARTVTGAYSDIGKDKGCKSNGSHGQSGNPGC